MKPPFQPNVKLLGVYPLPWQGIQLAATFQSLPGPQITASRTYTNAEIQPSLGRNLATGAAGTAVVPLIAPGTMYDERLYQLDFRASKIFRIGAAAALQANVDLYNAGNASSILANQHDVRLELAAADEHPAGPAAEVRRAVRFLGIRERSGRLQPAVDVRLKADATSEARMRTALAASCSRSLGAQARPPAPASVRMYVFDCGVLKIADPMPLFGLKKEEVGATDLSDAAYLIVHPRGTLMWDAGFVTDSDIGPARRKRGRARRARR